MREHEPTVGAWYRFTGSDLFEIVAYDADEGSIELQYFDGTIEEMDIEDWEAAWRDATIETAEPPEDWSGSVDMEPEDEVAHSSDEIDNDRRMWAGALDEIDLFESR
jgi:hypothetical protein